jgi:dipeptidase
MCGTFVALKTATADGSVIFGKNNDREPNEAMALEWVPGGTHGSDERVSCTHVEIPQARQPFDVLLCHPFWMWGAEMGANEKGLVVGNEAVFTRMPVDRRTTGTGCRCLPRSGTGWKGRLSGMPWPPRVRKTRDSAAMPSNRHGK